MAETSEQASNPPGSVDHALLGILFGSEEGTEAVFRRCRSLQQAEILVDRSIAWGVTPTLARRIRPWAAELPAAVATRLDAVTRIEAAKTLRLAARGAAAVAALLDAGIQATCFKGLAMVARARTMPQRSMSDVDLLVAEDSLADAITTLEAVGFSLGMPGSLRDYVDFIRNAPHFSGNRAVPLVDAAGHSLDLHWGFGAMCGPTLSPAAVLDRSVVGRIFGKTIRSVSRTDGLLFAAHHAMRENFTPTAAVKNLLDIDALVCSGGSEAIDEQVLAGAGTPAIALDACASILAHWNRGDELRGCLAPVLHPATHHFAIDLAAVFESQLDAAPLNRDVLHLMHPAMLREVLQTALLHPLRNRCFMAAIGGLPDRKRLWRLLADLRRVRLRDLRLYRSLARAKRTRLTL